MMMQDDTLESIFESLETPTAEQMFDSVREPRQQRPRMNTHISSPRQPIVHNIPIRQPPNYAAISAATGTLALLVFSFIMLYKTDVCYGCAYTSLLAALLAFWAGFLSALKVNNHQ